MMDGNSALVVALSCETFYDVDISNESEVISNTNESGSMILWMMSRAYEIKAYLIGRGSPVPEKEP
jgi:hypothetical protein